MDFLTNFFSETTGISIKVLERGQHGVTTKDIDLLFMIISYLLLLIPVIIIVGFKIPLLKKMGISLLRMTLQLIFVGIYLQFIFHLNNPFINFIWVISMIIIAAMSVINNAGVKARVFFPSVCAGMFIGSVSIAGIFVFIIIQPEPFYDARYLIPIMGMILGNCLRANVISMERFYSTIKKEEDTYISYLLMGATLLEAVRPYLRDSLKAAISPILATIATIGLVSLPGMMTGQILGGSSPVVAIKYQIAIMIAIFSASALTATSNLLLSLPRGFNKYSILRENIMK